MILYIFYIIGALISICQFTEGNESTATKTSSIKNVVINDGSYLILKCKFKTLMPEEYGQIKWEKDNSSLQEENINITDNIAVLNISNVSVKDTGLYIVRLTGQPLQCQYHVRINVTDYVPEILCSCVDLDTWNCSFEDSVYFYKKWISRVKDRSSSESDCQVDDTTNIISCKGGERKHFSRPVVPLVIEGFNATSYTEFNIPFQIFESMTIGKRPSFSPLSVNSIDRSVHLKYKLSSKSFYVVKFLDDKKINFKILIEDQWGSRQEIITDQQDFTIHYSYPFTNYTVKVSCQVYPSPFPHIWSPTANKSFTSAQEVPEMVPSVTNGFFRDLSSGSFIIYWKELEQYDYNGANFGYILKCNGKYITSTTNNYFLIKNYYKLCLNNPIEIFTKNDLGISKNSSLFYIRENASISIPSFVDIFHERIDNEDVFEFNIFWNNSSMDIDRVANYTIYYCTFPNTEVDDWYNKPRNDWITLPNETTYLKLKLPSHSSGRYCNQFGISTQDNISSSGVEWIHCITPKERDGVQNVQNLALKDYESTWVRIKWSFPCERRSRNVKGFIVYWSEQSSNLTINNSNILDPHQASYLINDLKYGTNYKVKVETVIVGKLNVFSETDFRTISFPALPGERHSSEVLAIILLAVLAILIMAVLLFLGVKHCKNERKKVLIHLPKGLSQPLSRYSVSLNNNSKDSGISINTDNVKITSNDISIINVNQANDNPGFAMIPHMTPDGLDAKTSSKLNKAKTSEDVSPDDMVNERGSLSLSESFQTSLGESEVDNFRKRSDGYLCVDAVNMNPSFDRCSSVSPGYVRIATGNDSCGLMNEFAKKDSDFIPENVIPSDSSSLPNGTISLSSQDQLNYTTIAFANL